MNPLMLPAGTGAIGPVGQLSTAAQPFTWGKAGRRMTAEDIAVQQELAATQMQAGSDYSPIGHWTQGLARVAQGVMGGLKARDAGRAADANAAESDAVMRALLGGETGIAPTGNRDAVVAAMLNPNISREARGFAEGEYARMNPKASPATEFERELEASGVQRGTPQWATAMQKRVENKINPIVNATVGGRDFFGPRDLLLQNLQGGGDPASTGPGAGPPPTLPPDFDFGGPTPQASGTFRAQRP